MATKNKRAIEEVEETVNPETVVAVAGSYEGGIYGWTSNTIASEGNSWQLDTPKVEWAFGGHLGAIKTIAIDENGEILATGGVDEYIKIYNLKTRKEKGELTQHNGSITALKFFKSSHLLSASNDGTLCIWSTRDWMCLHIMGGHKESITCISIHPTGRMALTGSLDKTIRLWNLVEGRCAFISKPNYQPKHSVIELIEWSSSGSSYAVVSGGNLNLYDASQEGKPVAFTTHSQTRRINALKFIGDDLVVIGGDDCLIQVISTKNGEILHSSNKGDARIKDLSLYQQESESRLPLLFSVTSSGHFQLWEVPTDKAGSLRVVTFGAAPGSASRLTCGAITIRTPSLEHKSKQIKEAVGAEEVEEEEEEEEEEEVEVPVKKVKVSKKEKKAKRNKSSGKK